MMSTCQSIKERPILFSAPMVRAILAGRKTQTRRIVKPQPFDDGFDLATYHQTCVDRRGNQYPSCEETFGIMSLSAEWSIKCPYGQVGDRLWVREAWTPDHAAFYPHFPVCYRADFGIEYERENGKVYSSEQKNWFPFRWRPSIHMPRSVCRIVLEIISIRVERLQAISKHDARCEGMEKIGYSENAIEQPGGVTMVDVGCWKNYEDASHPFCGILPERSFQSLWNVINGPESWAANPWVWVVEFKRIEEKRC